MVIARANDGGSTGSGDSEIGLTTITDAQGLLDDAIGQGIEAGQQAANEAEDQIVGQTEDIQATVTDASDAAVGTVTDATNRQAEAVEDTTTTTLPRISDSDSGEIPILGGTDPKTLALLAGIAVVGYGVIL